MMKKDQNEDLHPYCLDKVKNTMGKKQSHLVGYNYRRYYLLFMWRGGPKGECCIV